MSTSSIVLTLIDPKIFYGIWHSHGTSLPKGLVLTVSTFWYAFISSAIALFMAWTVSRIWRIFGVIIFQGIFRRTTVSLEESQCAALLVNSKAALDAFVASATLMSHKGAKRTLSTILFVSVFVVALGGAIPLIAFFPTFNQAITTSEHCGIFPISELGLVLSDPDLLDAGVRMAGKQLQLTAAALASSEQENRTVPSKHPTIKSTAITESLPTPIVSYQRVCPPTTAACSSKHPFTYSSDYTLLPHHFGLNIDIDFSFQVLNTCYRPVNAVETLRAVGNNTQFGLFYGPLDTPGIDLNGSLATETFFEERRLSPGYTLSGQTARADDDHSIGSYWIPNASLVLGGDTTILFYFVGGVATFSPISDPIFESVGEPSGDLGRIGKTYRTFEVVSPIICDTQYHFCTESNKDCSPVGGFYSLSKWFSTKSDNGWRDLKTFFEAILFIPPIYTAAHGLGAVAASKTVIDTGGQSIQFDGSVNVTRELNHLVRATVSMLASSAQLVASGYWYPGKDFKGYSPNRSICQNAMIETSGAISILLFPYLILLGIAFPVFIISYAKYFGVRRIRVWRKYADPWTLYCAGQLHREVAERIGGTVGKVDLTAKWPPLAPGHPGLDFGDEDGTRHFGHDVPYTETPLAKSEFANISPPANETGLATYSSTHPMRGPGTVPIQGGNPSVTNARSSESDQAKLSSSPTSTSSRAQRPDSSQIVDTSGTNPLSSVKRLSHGLYGPWFANQA